MVLPIPERANEMIQNMCNHIGFIYIYNQNIRKVHLRKDGICLVESGKIIVTNNFLNFLSKDFFIHVRQQGKLT